MIASFIIGSFAINLNYALDIDEPEIYTAKVTKKEIDSQDDDSDTYKLYFQLEDQAFELKVSRSEYNRYEVGDDYPFKRYEGAFGEPFYVSGKYA